MERGIAYGTTKCSYKSERKILLELKKVVKSE